MCKTRALVGWLDMLAAAAGMTRRSRVDVIRWAMEARLCCISGGVKDCHDRFVFSDAKCTNNSQEEREMNQLILKLRSLVEREEGQDLVEYALVVALIAFGAVTAMKGLSSEINTAFMTISSDLGSSL
jgi:pilus assembly protein Flp/PilA